MRIHKTSVLLGVILGATLGLRAQTITWSTAQTILSASDVVNTGTLLGSWAPGDANSASFPVNGVTFAPNSLPGFNPSGFISYLTDAGSPGTPDANYNALMEFLEYGGSYSNPNVAEASVSWSGMIPGDTYEVELWVSDARSGYNFTQSEYVIGGNTFGVDMGGPVAILTPETGGPGQFITGTFVASTARETIGFVPVSSQAGSAIPQINLFQVRDISVPEPSTIGLTVVGLLLARFLRRRHA